MKLFISLLTIIMLVGCESSSEPTKLPDDLISEVIDRDFVSVSEVKSDYTNGDHFHFQVNPNKDYTTARIYLNGSCNGDYKTFTKEELINGVNLELLPNQENNIKAIFTDVDGVGVSSKCQEMAKIVHDNIPPQDIPTPNSSMKELDGKYLQENKITMDIKNMSIPEGSERLILYADPLGKELLATITQEDIDRGSISVNIKENDTTSIYMAYADKSNNIGKISGPVASYTHDSTKPELTTVAENSIFAPGDIFEGTCKDVEKVTISSPLNQEIECINEKYSFILPNNEGDFEVVISAADEAGNKANISVNILVDGTPPVITSFEPIQKLNGQGTNQNPIQLDLSEYVVPADINSIEIYDENNNLLGSILKSDFDAKIYNLTLPLNKTTNFKLIAIDRAKNRSNLFDTNTTYTHDNIAPNLSASIASLVKNHTPITGICDFKVKLSGDLGYESNCEGGTYSLSIGVISDGVKNVKVISSDLYGNTSEKSISFKVDNTPPIVYTHPMFDFGFRTAELNYTLKYYDIYFNRDATNVKFCSNADCSSVISEMSIATYKANGVMLTLAENAKTSFYVEPSDQLGNSKIYGPYVIETDTSVPDAPTINEETIALATKIVSEDVVKIGGTSPADAIGIDIYLASDLEMPFMGFGTEEWNNSNFDLWPVQNSSTEYVAYAVNDVGTRSATGVSFRVNHATYPMYDYHFSESDLQLGKYFKGMGSPLTFTVQNKSFEINTGLEVDVEVNLAFFSENIDKIESECIEKTVAPNESCTFTVYPKDTIEKGEYGEFIDFSMNDSFTSVYISYSISNLVLANTEFTDYRTQAVRKIKPTINSNGSSESIIFYPGDDKICISNTDECFINETISNSLKLDNFFAYYPMENLFFFNKENLMAVDLLFNNETIIGIDSPTELYKNYLGNYVLEKNGEYKTWSPSFNRAISTIDDSGLLLAKKNVNNIDSFIGDYYIGKDVLLNSEGSISHSFSDIHMNLPNGHKYSNSKVHSILKIDEDNILIIGTANGTEEVPAIITERDPAVGEYYCLDQGICIKAAPGSDYGYTFWAYSPDDTRAKNVISGWEVFLMKLYGSSSNTTSHYINGWTWRRGTYRKYENYSGFRHYYYGVYRTREVSGTKTVSVNDLFAVSYSLASGQYTQTNIIKYNKDISQSDTIFSSLLNEKASLIHVPFTDRSDYYYFINTESKTFEDFSNYGNLSKPFKNGSGDLFVNSSDMTNSYFISSIGEKKHINLLCNEESTNVFQLIANKVYSYTSNYICETDLDAGITTSIPVDVTDMSQIYTSESNEKIAILKGLENDNIKIIKLDFESSDYTTLLDYTFDNASNIDIINEGVDEPDPNLVELEGTFNDNSKRIYIFDLSKI